jgi:hypothetical protein
MYDRPYGSNPADEAAAIRQPPVGYVGNCYGFSKGMKSLVGSGSPNILNRPFWTDCA